MAIVTTVLTAAKLLTPLTEIEAPQVTIEDGCITSIESRGALALPDGAEHLDFPDATLVPGYFDVHIHGAMGHNTMEGTGEAFDAIGKFLLGRGVAAYLPTTVTAPIDMTLRALEGMARQIERADKASGESVHLHGAKALGIHLEGPFLSHSKRGVQPAEYLQEPSIDLLRRFWEAARGHVVLMTVAPELPGAIPLIQEAVRLGIRVSLGHSNATTPEAEAGVAAGAVSATHTFNAMRPLDHREPGLLGVVLDEADLYAELICDGIHVDPLLVRLFHKAKTPDRGILVTDAIAATGMPDGVYKLGTMDVTVANGKCMFEGKLAGSVLTMDRAVRNFVKFTRASYGVAAHYASANPARMTGFAETHGELAPGRNADITVLSPAGEVRGAFLNGQVFPG
ncbi:MAG: N-acetylglucosamine-6-phosphate deacetylase [Acidobacteriaceae bacterium]